MDLKALMLKAGSWLVDGFGCMFYLLPPNQLALEKGEAVPNYLATHGIAMFVVLISTELAIGYACSKKCVYRFNDFIGSLSSGTCQQLVGTLTSRLLNPKGSFTVVQSKYSLMTLNVKARPIQSWLLLMMGVDLAYYWAHRCLHVFHLGWAAHSVHHSGEDYNLPTALRQGALQPLMTWIFSLPLALFFPAESILVHLQLNTLYQFWIHTEFCGRLGWLEFLFNTPFHHRVHHRPPGNCNYAGVLIVWDRLFKTYSTETERLDHYGLAQPVRSFNVWELNLQHWRKIAGSSRGFQGVGLWRLIRASLGHRAHHPMRFSPQALLDPFDPMKNGSWALPKEATGKYQGADLTLLGKTAALTVFLGSFLCLQRAERKNVELMQLCCNVGVGLLWLGALGSMEQLLEYGSFLLNPWSLTFPMFVAIVIVKEAALQLTDFCVTCACQCLKPLPSRTGTRSLYKNKLDNKDAAFLAINSLIETIFTGHLAHKLWYSSWIERSFWSLGILNGPIALLLLILFNDMLYAPAHRLLHHPSLYAYIHKHHHRSVYPFRGNIDARNEHPIEQLIAMSLWMIAVYMTAFSVGMHAACLAGHLTLMMTGASLNHAGFDLEIRFLGVDWYSTAAHEMHHRRPDKNFAQFTMFWDKLMGTYIPYIQEDEKADKAN